MVAEPVITTEVRTAFGCQPSNRGISLEFLNPKLLNLETCVSESVAALFVCGNPTTLDEDDYETESDGSYLKFGRRFL